MISVNSMYSFSGKIKHIHISTHTLTLKKKHTLTHKMSFYSDSAFPDSFLKRSTQLKDMVKQVDRSNQLKVMVKQVDTKH